MPRKIIQAEKNKDRVFSLRDGKKVILRADKRFLETGMDAAGRAEEVSGNDPCMCEHVWTCLSLPSSGLTYRRLKDLDFSSLKS